MAKADPPRPLHAELLRSQLAGCLIGQELLALPETTSTNDYVWELVQKGSARPGLVVFAEHQTAGRGQRGHSWESAAGHGLWFSIFLTPNIDLSQSARLTNWAARSVAETIAAELSLPATVKEPNDIYIEGRKVAGVLVEMRALTGAPHIAIAGIGVNVTQAQADFPDELRARATSLAMAADRPVDRAGFAVALLRNLDRSYAEAFGA